MTNYKSILIYFTVWQILTPHAHSLVKTKQRKKILFLVNKSEKLLIFQLSFSQIYPESSAYEEKTQFCPPSISVMKTPKNSYPRQNKKKSPVLIS